MLVGSCLSIIVIMVARSLAKPSPTGVVVKSISFFRTAPLCAYQDVVDQKATGAVAHRNAQTYNACKHRCDTSATCRGFNYNFRAQPWKGVRCWIHENPQMALHPQDQMDSYLRMSCFGDDCGDDRYQMNVNTRMTGGQAEPDITEPFLCAKACSESPYCYGFDFSRNESHSQSTQCWLHEDASLLSTLIETEGINHYAKTYCVVSPQDLPGPQTPQPEEGVASTNARKSSEVLDISFPSDPSSPIDMEFIIDDFLPLVNDVIDRMSDPIGDTEYDDFVDLAEQLLPVINELIAELSVSRDDVLQEEEDDGNVDDLFDRTAATWTGSALLSTLPPPTLPPAV